MNYSARRGRSWLSAMGVAALPLVAALLTTSAARAGDDPSHGTGFFDSVLETLNLKTKAGPMPGFVEETRPDPSRLKYIPTGRTHPKRSIAVETPAQVDATKQALDAARDAQLNPKPVAPKPAPGLKPAAKAKRATPTGDAAMVN